MRIIIKSPNEKPIRLFFPARLLFNGFIARIGFGAINRYIPSDKIKLKSHDLRMFMKEFRRIKHKYPDFVLVDIESSKGDIVQIKF